MTASKSSHLTQPNLNQSDLMQANFIQADGGALQTLSRFLLRRKSCLLLLWDILTFGVVGVNSFILLLYKHSVRSKLKYVICIGAVAYMVILLLQAILLRKHPDRRRRLTTTKRVFRLIYTALYLTAIMMDILAATLPGSELQLAYNICLFVFVSLWGTNFLWIWQIYRRFRDFLSRTRFSRVARLLPVVQEGRMTPLPATRAK